MISCAFDAKWQISKLKADRPTGRRESMTGTNSKKIGAASIFCMAIITFALVMPLICYGDEYPLEVDFSPKIINIASNHLGDIRVLTGMSYAAFIADGDSIFLYFNDGSSSVPNIVATRDSLGHLILRFTLEDLLAVRADLKVDAFNNTNVVLVMRNGDEYIGSDDEVYIVDKIAP
jgi:hypothetical protein